jgi:hypothetical protein
MTSCNKLTTADIDTATRDVGSALLSGFGVAIGVMVVESALQGELLNADGDLVGATVEDRVGF